MKSELENTMLKPAILALIRQILTVAGTALVAKGYVQASDIEPVIGALLTIGSVLWSFRYLRRLPAKLRPLGSRGNCAFPRQVG
jgi:positive regulator of sigma E activity